MIQQNPASRLQSVEDVKGELIGHRNAFVARQILDAKRREVVPAQNPGQVAPVRLVAVDDWDNGTLKLRLDRAPEPGWVARFQQPRSGYTSVMGAGPTAFQFQGDRASIHAEERSVQQIINHFKNYLDMTTRDYQADLNEKAARDEQQLRRKLEQEVAEAERRSRVLGNLTI